MPPATQRTSSPAASFVAAAPMHDQVEVVERTSLAERSSNPDEVTVRFTRWHAHANTAYQKGQFAGFARHVAQRLVAGGFAQVAETAQQRRDAADRFMVTK